MRFSNGGILVGSNCIEPSFLLNINDELHSVRRAHFNNIKTFSNKCQVCSRRDGRPRKNKEFFDDNRGVSFLTGEKTVVKKMELTLHNEQPWQVLPIWLCQECILVIETKETHFITKLNISILRLTFSHSPELKKYRFIRREEVAVDSKFMQVSVKGEASMDFYGRPHFHPTDSIDRILWMKVSESLPSLLQNIH